MRFIVDKYTLHSQSVYTGSNCRLSQMLTDGRTDGRTDWRTETLVDARSHLKQEVRRKDEKKTIPMRSKEKEKRFLKKGNWEKKKKIVKGQNKKR